MDNMSTYNAISWLQAIERDYIHGGDEDQDKKRKEAISLAIKSLEERKQGEWILVDEESNTWKCTHCIELGKDDWWQLNEGTPQDNHMDFCPHCGAEMRGSKNGQKTGKRNH